MSARLRFAAIAGLLLVMQLAGCVSLRDPESSFEYTGDIVAIVDSTQTVGQTFICRRSRLNNLQLWLRKGSDLALDTDVLIVSLYHDQSDAQGNAGPLVTVPITYSQIARSFPVTIAFPALDDPPGQRYYLSLATIGGPIQAFGRSEDAYPDGSLYINGKAEAMDMAMRISYNYDAKAILDDLARSIPNLWLVLPLLLLLWAPGQLILELINALRIRQSPHTAFLSHWSWGERLALAVGLSLALTPLLMLWTSTLGLHWNQGAVVTAAGLAAGCLAALTWRRRRHAERFPPPDALDLCLLGLFLLALAMRLAMVRDLAAPAWVDSVHHTTITRLIVELGAFPQSYAPYVSAQHASYHPGFHNLVASFHWLSGLELSQAMLLLGQVFNALSLLAVYLLTTTFTKDRIAGLIAALATGFLSSMPAYYASWGRYTQLNGLLVMAACTALIARLLSGRVFPPSLHERSSNTFKTEEANSPYPPSVSPTPLSLFESLKLVALVSLSSAGMFLIHYRVAGFWGMLLLAWLLAELLRSLDKQPLWKTIPLAIIWIAAAGLPALLISLPWWPELLRSMILPGLSATPTAPQPLKIDWGYLTPGYGKQVLALAGAGLLISILRARWFGPVMALWIGLLLISANQGVIPLPGTGFINRTSVEIMFFMPLSLLAGYCLSFIIRGLGKFIPAWGQKPYAVLLIIAGTVVALAGARLLLPIINPITLLYREADRPAIEWIARNINQDETILINPFLWGYGIYAGQDGGYWITPLAGIKTMPPPVLYAYGNPDQVQRITQTCKKTLEQAGDPQALHALLHEQSIRYVYIGRRGGVLSPKRLSESGLFQVLYTQAGTWIFEVK